MVNDSAKLNTLQKDVLSKLGRNIFHFQHLEQQLKLLVLFCEFQSPLDQFATNHKKKADSIRTKTLGTLVSELHSLLYGKPADPDTTNAITKASLAIGFRVEADPNYINKQKQKLNDLVIERNQLIHQDLVTFEPASAENCRHWICRLDEQNERIMIQLNVARQLVDTCRQSFQELLTAMDSEEWRSGFKPR